MTTVGIASSPHPVASLKPLGGSAPLVQVKGPASLKPLSARAASQPPGHVDRPAPFKVSADLQQVLNALKTPPGCACLHSRCGPRIMEAASFDSEVGKILLASGSAPAGLGPALADLKSYHDQLAAGVGTGSGARDQADKLKAQLGKLETALAGLLSAVPATASMIAELNKQIASEKSLIDAVLKEPKAQGMKWKDALAGANYRLLEAVSRNNDAYADQRTDASTGMLSQVTKIKYKWPDGEKILFFKPDVEKFADPQGHFGALSDKVGIGNEAVRDLWEKTNFAARNVATAFMNEALGLRNAPHCSFAIDHGKIGYVATQAGGVQCDRLPPLTGLSSTDTVGLCRELLSLQYMDAICGQVDRHNGNYFVDLSGGNVTVTGIDNDIGFGSKLRVNKDWVDPMEKWLPLPSIIDKGLADRISGLNFDLDLKPTLSTLLEKDEVDATRSRFQEVQSHIANLRKSGMVVDDWQKLRDPSSPLSVDKVLVGKGDSYVNRDFSITTEPTGFRMRLR